MQKIDIALKSSVIAATILIGTGVGTAAYRVSNYVNILKRDGIGAAMFDKKTRENIEKTADNVQDFTHKLKDKTEKISTEELNQNGILGLFLGEDRSKKVDELLDKPVLHIKTSDGNDIAITLKDIENIDGEVQNAVSSGGIGDMVKKGVEFLTNKHKISDLQKQIEELQRQTKRLQKQMKDQKDQKDQ